MKRVNQIEDGIPPTAQTTGWTKMMEQYLLHLIGLNVGITHNVAIRSRHIYQRHLIARTHTRDGFDPHMDTQLLTCLHHSFIHLCCSTRLTTILHTQPHLTLNIRLLFCLLRHGCSFHLLKFIQHLTNLARQYRTENPFINLHHWCQRTTAQARHLLDGVLPVGCGDVITLQLQLTPERIVHVVSALHMTGRTDAHLDDMFAIRNHPQLRIEGCHANELGAVNIRPFIQTVERIGRQVIEFLLYGLQERDNQFSSCAYPVNDGIRFAIYNLFRFHFIPHTSTLLHTIQ